VAQVDVRSQVVSFARQIAAWLERGPFALALCALLAAAVLLPRLDRPGLWEPQERQLSDRIAPPVPSGGDKTDRPPAKATPAGDGCLRSVPVDAAARTLTARAIKWGRDAIDDSDGGRRLPLALLGLLTVLAAAGTAMRLAGARAGVVTAIMLLAMPLLALQSRMLTSEIGTACGASLRAQPHIVATLARVVDSSPLAGRVAFVTGASRGIGRAIALALATDGADVAINYRRDEAAAIATVADIEALGRRSAAYAASVDDPEACAAMAATVLDDFGPIDLLVHNAGIASRGLNVVKTEVDEIERNFRTHALAAFVLCKAFVPGMRDADRGDVVMISSVATSHMAPNSSPYNMGKYPNVPP